MVSNTALHMVSVMITTRLIIHLCVKRRWLAPLLEVRLQTLAAMASFLATRTVLSFCGHLAPLHRHQAVPAAGHKHMMRASSCSNLASFLG